MRASTGYRLAGLAAVGLWGAAISLPIYTVDAGDLFSAAYDGREVLAIGAFGVLAGAFAWWANLPWAWTTIRMLRGKAPGPVLTLVSGVLALTALSPMQLPGAHEGVTGQAVPQIGAFIWVAAFVPAVVAVVLGRRAERRRRTAASASGFVADADVANEQLARFPLDLPEAPIPSAAERTAGGFVADGQRTYDPVRGLELKITGVDKEQLTGFQLETPEGPVYFFGYPSFLDEDHPDRKAPPGQPHIRWEIDAPSGRGADGRTREEIWAIAVEALTAYGYGPGGYPAHVEVVRMGYSSRPSPASSS